MAPDSKSQSPVHLCPSSYKLHAFDEVIGSTNYMFQVIKMPDSTYIWIGQKYKPHLGQIAMGMQTRHQASPIPHALLPCDADTIVKNLAAKMCVRLKKIVYMACGFPMDAVTVRAIEKRLHEEIVRHPHLF